ncbi:MAG: hypothetical protein L6277_06195 [Desulfobacterales bacterium]|nr:hypothetical protein [Pseudomonadota bacterium]MCG2771663.1 hypothetical protein [Desulfobacterales bacterium]
MSKYTQAYSNFIKRISEISAVRRLATKHSRLPTITRSAYLGNALCRAAVVLLSGHIEGYIENLAEIGLERIFSKKMIKSKLANSFLYHCSKDIITEIKNASNPNVISTKVKLLIDRDSDIWSNAPIFNSTLPSELFIHGFGNPTFDEIKKFFRRFGYLELSHDLSNLLRGNYFVCVNMINHVVDQRNKIAHGDFTIVNTPRDIENMIQLVILFCRCTDIAVSNWFKLKGCLIR